MAMARKKIVFLTGTRADFGKVKSLIAALHRERGFDIHIFVTGMHMQPKYGGTVDEIEKCGFSNIYKFINYNGSAALDTIFANTVAGFGDFVRAVKPDMIVVHGDRTEAFAGALVGSLNNILVAHIEGGEVSGTVDEHIRHAISKISHLHFVANAEARKRLLQMGESSESVFAIGSPDLDLMTSEHLPTFDEVRAAYELPFTKYGIVLFHPVTTEPHALFGAVEALTDALVATAANFVVIYPNNDPGNDIILSAYERKLASRKRFAIFPSMRFEHFLTLLKHTNVIVGNSSAGIREAPYYGVPAINVGNRQHHRLKSATIESVFNCAHAAPALTKLLKRFMKTQTRFAPSTHFGNGDSAANFVRIVKTPRAWKTSTQKHFSDVDF